MVPFLLAFRTFRLAILLLMATLLVAMTLPTTCLAVIPFGFSRGGRKTSTCPKKAKKMPY